MEWSYTQKFWITHYIPWANFENGLWTHNQNLCALVGKTMIQSGHDCVYAKSALCGADMWPSWSVIMKAMSERVFLSYHFIKCFWNASFASFTIHRFQDAPLIIGVVTRPAEYMVNLGHVFCTSYSTFMNIKHITRFYPCWYVDSRVSPRVTCFWRLCF